MLYPTELQRLATPAGLEPATLESMYSEPAVGLFFIGRATRYWSDALLFHLSYTHH
jgi:hypothetical protein